MLPVFLSNTVTYPPVSHYCTVDKDGDGVERVGIFCWEIRRLSYIVYWYRNDGFMANPSLINLLPFFTQNDTYLIHRTNLILIKREITIYICNIQWISMCTYTEKMKLIIANLLPFCFMFIIVKHLLRNRSTKYT